jgi:hypothetical protein
MKIRFLVEYFYYPAAPEEKRFIAELLASLPKEKNEDSISHCYLGRIGYYKVKSDSGINRGNLREVGVTFYASSFEELNEKIENAIEDYRRQVVKNIEIIQKIPTNGEIIKDFPDPIEDEGSIIGDVNDITADDSDQNSND